MSGATKLRGGQPGPLPEAPPLVCRLRRKEVVGRRGPVRNMGEVELENRSSDPLEIAYHMTALQHLNLVIRKPSGEVVSEGHFGDRFAPTAAATGLRLMPGEKFTANVHLLATAPRQGLPPGVYLIQAVYECDGLRAVSEPLQVELFAAE